MDPRKIVLKQTAVIALGEALCSAVMVGIFTALGYFQWNVLWSALVGSVVIVGNHFAMAVTVNVAADRAQGGDPKQAQKLVQLSSVVRLIVMGVILFAAIKLDANLLALLLPLAFVRPILMVTEFFGKKAD